MTDYKDEIRDRAGFDTPKLRPQYTIQPGEYAIEDLAAADPKGFSEGKSLIELQNLGPQPELENVVEYRRVSVDKYSKDPTGFVATLSEMVGKDPATIRKSAVNRNLPESDLRALVGEGYSPNPKQVDYLAGLVEDHVSTANRAVRGWEQTGRYYPIWIDSGSYRVIDGNHRAAAFVAYQPNIDPLTWVSNL